MKFKTEGKEFPYTTYSLTESFNQVVSTLVLESNVAPISDVEVIFPGGASVTMTPVKVEMQGPVRTTLYPKEYINLLKKTYLPLTGDYTMFQILDKYGIEYAAYSDTPSQYWEIPQLKFLNLLDYLKYKWNTGSSPLSTITASGAYFVVDIEKALKRTPKKVSLKSFKQSWDATWLGRVPLDIEVNYNSIEQDIQEQVSIESDISKSRISQFITNSKLNPLFSTELKNKMGVSRFTSCYLELTGDGLPPVLGSVLSIKQAAYLVTKIVVSNKEVTLGLSKQAV